LVIAFDGTVREADAAMLFVKTLLETTAPNIYWIGEGGAERIPNLLCNGSLADTRAQIRDVRFAAKSGHSSTH
jgi:hypothetical protein